MHTSPCRPRTSGEAEPPQVRAAYTAELLLRGVSGAVLSFQVVVLFCFSKPYTNHPAKNENHTRKKKKEWKKHLQASQQRSFAILQVQQNNKALGGKISQTIKLQIIALNCFFRGGHASLLFPGFPALFLLTATNHPGSDSSSVSLSRPSSIVLPRRSAPWCSVKVSLSLSNRRRSHKLSVHLSVHPSATQ